jgi:hypothetical protein
MKLLKYANNVFQDTIDLYTEKDVQNEAILYSEKSRLEE